MVCVGGMSGRGNVQGECLTLVKMMPVVSLSPHMASVLVAHSTE